MSAQHRQSEHSFPRNAARWLAPLALVLGLACLSLAGGAAPAAADQWSWSSGQSWGGQSWGGQNWGQQWSKQKWSHKNWSRKNWSDRNWSQGGWSHKKWSKWDWKDNGRHHRHHRHKFHHGFPPRFVFGGNGFFFSKPGFFVPPHFVVRQPTFIVRQPGFIVHQPGFAAVPTVVIKRHPSLEPRMAPVMRSAGPRFVTPGMMNPSIRIIRPGN